MTIIIRLAQPNPIHIDVDDNDEDQVPDLLEADSPPPELIPVNLSENAAGPSGSTSSIEGSSRGQQAEGGGTVDKGLDQYERRKVPLTILTGYLGAGKSTLLE